jgi:peptidoglycan/xylan/chitin deacetylase (PgdA/CDA1 family)
MTILCYHSVEPNWPSPLAVSPAAFAVHCSWLARNRHVLDLREAVSWLSESGRLPRGMTALTFDDGFRGVFEHAFPILMRHRLTATVFVVAETLEPGGRRVDWVDDPPQFPLTTLSVEEIAEMQKGGIAFGSHSYGHRDLTTLSERECEDDLRHSRTLLEDILTCHIPFLAYPRGRHDEKVRRAAKRAGYTHAFALPDAPEMAGPYAVPRAGVYPGNGVGALRVKTAPWYLALRTSGLFPLLRTAASLGRNSPPSGPPG